LRYGDWHDGLQRQGNQGDTEMNSEIIARVLGAIIGVAALIMAFTYAPPWQTAKPEKPVQQVEPPKTAPAAPPVARGPVVREIPQ
jgi:hypothetical protein